MKIRKINKDDGLRKCTNTTVGHISPYPKATHVSMPDALWAYCSTCASKENKMKVYCNCGRSIENEECCCDNEDVIWCSFCRVHYSAKDISCPSCYQREEDKYYKEMDYAEM